MKIIISIIICFTLTILYLVIYFIGWLFVTPFQKDRKILGALSQIYAKIFIYSSLWWRIKVNGIENMQRGKPYMIMCNHQSMLDIPLVLTLKKKMLWVAKRELMKVPIFNVIALLRSDILITRGSATDTKKMFRRCQNEIKNGISIAIFPEGTRTKDGKISSFKDGAFVAAKLGGADILPIVIDGSYDATHPENGRGFRFPITFKINILEPITYESFKSTKTKELRDIVHEKMLNCHKQIRPELYN